MSGWRVVQVVGPALNPSVSSATSAASAVGTPIGVGNIVFGVVAFGTDTAADLTSIGDNASTPNSFPVVDVVNGAGNQQSWATFWKKNVTGGGTVLTAHFSPALDFIGIWWVELNYDGAPDTSTAALDQHNIALLNPAGTGTDAISLSVTTTTNGDFVVALIGDPDGVSTSYSLDSGGAFTQLAQGVSPAAGVPFLFESTVQSTAGAITAHATHTPSGKIQIGVLAFSPPTATVPPWEVWGLAPNWDTISTGSVTLAQATWKWVGTALGVDQRQQLTLIQKAWSWLTAAPGVDQRQNVTLTQRLWQWLGSAPGVNQRQGVTLSQVLWRWVGNALGVNQRQQLTLTQQAWQWLGQAATFINGTTITLVQQAWRWIGQAAGVNQRQQPPLAQQPWDWTGQPGTFTNNPSSVPLTQRLWNWTATALGIDQKQQAILAQVAWRWIGNPIAGGAAAATQVIQGFIAAIGRMMGR